LPPAPDARYAVQRLLGAGGMGEVHLCRDGRLGRDVAMKVIRGATALGSEGAARFVNEARLQGQLEHPAIVPVYDLATDTQGQPYFTMKRIAGTTLREVLDELADGSGPVSHGRVSHGPVSSARGKLLRDASPQARAGFTRRKLVGLIAQVANAVGFAHARGVTHRDLKPENLMFGEFGEVYVLDWGVARAPRAASPGTSSTQRAAPPLDASLASPTPPPEGEPTTQDGALVGTPGYMAPEQAQGDAERVGPASDVYALGCVLFEVLSGRAAHEGVTTAALLASTLTRSSLSPCEAAPDREVPAELDAICRTATSLVPGDRHADGRELARALEDFLDGERSLELRRAEAIAHLDRAEATLREVAEGRAGETEREAGLRELGRALALDPSNDRALTLVSRLVFSDRTLPPGAVAELEAVELEDRRRGNRIALVAYAVWFLFSFAGFYRPKSVALAVAMSAGILALLIYSAWMNLSGNVQRRFMRVAIVANFLLVALNGAYLGPLLVVPGLASVVSASFLVGIRATRETKLLLLGGSLFSFLAPFGLSLLGVVENAYSFESGGMMVRSLSNHLDSPVASLSMLTVVGIAQQLVTFRLVGSATDRLVRAERRNLGLAYRLRQLLPRNATVSG
jgi:eukaryotic-like serine/threonine-protein kinase